jgi:putative DNA methylase
LLTAILEAGLSITATWPIKTELGNRMRSQGSNALASSIVLACRPRSLDAPSMDRRGFTLALKKDLPSALRNLQQGSIAPVDLAQATIGPGMAIFSSVARVNEVDGTDMKVSTALAIINQVLAEILSEQEGDFDAETRFCIKWFSQFGWNEGESGQADLLSKAVNTSLNAVERGGIFRASAGKARLKHPSEMSKSWDPLLDKSISVWEVAVRLAYSLQSDGATAANELVTQSRKRVDLDSVKELSYLLYSISEKNNWNDSALLFNGLGTSWSDLEKSVSQNLNPAASQEMLDL